MTKIITELCQNHNGNMDVLRDMIMSAKEGGSDIVKIQSIKADTLTKRNEYETFRKYKDEYERFKTLELTYDNEKEFVELSRSNNLIPMTTIFSTKHHDYYNSVGYGYLKLSGYSMEEFDYGLKLDKFNFKHLVFSTSSLTWEEIKRCVDNLKGIEFTMLNCTCVYPTSLDKLNLQNIPFYKKEFNLDNVGLSDHSNPYEDNLLSSKLAIFQGIDVLERHFTILDKDETRDGKVSVTPEMIVELINFSKLSKINQYKEINKFNEKQVFNHSYYSTRF